MFAFGAVVLIGMPNPDLEELQQERLWIITSELEAARGFIDLAQTARLLGDHEHPARLLRKAENAIEVVDRLLGELTPGGEKLRLSGEVEALKNELGHLAKLLRNE